MSRQPSRDGGATIRRPFAIFVEEAYDMPGTWLAHVVGHGLDNVTQGTGPQDAVFMAYDMLNAITDRCHEGDHVHDYSVDTVLSESDSLIEELVPAWGCSRCGARAAKDQFDE